MHVVNGQIEWRRVVCVLHGDVSALVQQQLDRLHVTATAGEVQRRVLMIAILPVLVIHVHIHQCVAWAGIYCEYMCT